MSQFSYCSQVWRPRFVSDFTSLEQVQWRAIKYILNYYSADYRQRLISLKLLPLMYFLELLDILFFIKSLKFPDPSFPVLNYVTFLTPTQDLLPFPKWNITSVLQDFLSTLTSPKLHVFGTLSLLLTLLFPSLLSNFSLKGFFGLTSLLILTLYHHVLIMLSVLVTNVVIFPLDIITQQNLPC